MILAADQLLYLAGLFAIFVFAISGALAAAERHLDIFAFILFGTATALGGGTLRDFVLNTSVFWVDDPTYLYVAIFASVLTYTFSRRLESNIRTLIWMDAVGMTLFSVLATEKSLFLGVEPAIAITMGVITATFGGVARDIMLDRSPVLLEPEIYATAALLGSVSYFLFTLTDIYPVTTIFISTGLAFTLRGLAIIYDWRLPKYQPLYDDPYAMNRPKKNKRKSWKE